MNARDMTPPADPSIGLEEAAGIIQFHIAAWHEFGYESPPTPECKAIPPLGERSTEAVRSGYALLAAIDELSTQLASLRDQVTAELRTDAEAKTTRSVRPPEPEAGL